MGLSASGSAEQSGDIPSLSCVGQAHLGSELLLEAHRVAPVSFGSLGASLLREEGPAGTRAEGTEVPSLLHTGQARWPKLTVSGSGRHETEGSSERFTAQCV